MALFLNEKEDEDVLFNEQLEDTQLEEVISLEEDDEMLEQELVDEEIEVDEDEQEELNLNNGA